MDSKNRLMFILSLTLLLSMSLSPVCATKPSEVPKGWSGTQEALPLGDVVSIDWDLPSVTIHFGSGVTIHIVFDDTQGCAIIDISPMKLIVTRGYDFGNIQVDYEVITRETLVVPLSELGKPSINLYDYPHSGTFIWYNSQDEVVGTGNFWKNNGPPYGGSIADTVLKDKTKVEGIYRVKHWIDMTIPLQGFPNLKVPVELNHAGLYYQPSP